MRKRGRCRAGLAASEGRDQGHTVALVERVLEVAAALVEDDDHSADDAAVLQQELAVDVRAWVAEDDGLAAVALPELAHGGGREAEQLGDVPAQAPRVRLRTAGHVGAGHAPLVDGGGPDGVDGALSAEEVEPLGAVAGGVDVRRAGLLALVYEHAARNVDAGAGEEIDVRPHAGAADDHAGLDGPAALQRDAVAGPRSFDPRDLFAQQHVYPLLTHRLLEGAAALRVEELRHHLVRDLDDGELEAGDLDEGADGQQADEAGADDEAAPGAVQLRLYLPRVGEGPVVADVGILDPAHRRNAGGGAGGDEEPVVLDAAAVLQRHGPRLRIDGGGADAGDQLDPVRLVVLRPTEGDLRDLLLPREDVGQRDARVRRLRLPGDDGYGAIAVALADGVDRREAGGAVAP